MSEPSPSDILHLTPNDAASFLEEHGNPSVELFVSAFINVQNEVPERCKQCPWLAHFAIDVAMGEATIPSTLSELWDEEGFYNIASCPGADIDTIDGSNTVFEEIVVGYECGRVLEA